MNNCCICEKNVEREDAPILAMGGAGYARVLCDECDSELQTATRGRNVDEIKAAINSLSRKMADGDPDAVTFRMMSQILVESTDRAMAINEGSYDFALDDKEDEEGFDEIPEELLETEEDIEKDRQDEEKMKKFDKFYNYALIGALIGFAIFVAWKIIERFI